MGSSPISEVKKQQDSSIKIAVSYIQNKQYQRAFQILKQCITKPSMQVYQKMADLYEEIQLIDKAKQYYQKCLELSPDNPQILTKLAMIYDEKQQPEKSQQLVTKALKQQPERVQSLNFLAFLEFKLNKFDEAIEQLKFAIEKVNENQHSLKGSADVSDIILANLCNNLGNSLKYRQRYQQSIQYFDKAIKLNDENSLYYVNCALTLAHPQIQNYTKAYQYLLIAEKLLLSQKSQYNSFVLERIRDFREDIQEWNFKKKHNYTTQEEKQELLIKLKSLEKKISQLFCTQLEQSMVFFGKMTQQSDKKLLKISKVWNSSQMQISSIFDIDEQIFHLYEGNSHDFAIIPFHIVAFCIRSWRQGCKLKKIDYNIKEVLTKLEKKYPASKGNNEIKLTIESFEIPKDEKPDMFENNFFKSFENLMNEILKLSMKAKKIYPQFEQFIKLICLAKGFNFKSGLKFPDNIASEIESKIMIRVTEKLFKQIIHKKEQIFEQLQILLLQGQNEFKVSSLTSNFFKVWRRAISQILKQRIQNKEETKCYIYDLVRAKCMYKSHHDIQETAKNLLSECKNRNYRVIQCDNRLTKSTRDLVFKINIKGVVGEIQLASQFDTSLNQFSHGIYQIQRSPGGCLFGSVIWLGKLKKLEFIKDIRRIYYQLQNMLPQNKQLYQTKLDLEYVLTEFENMQKK